ncbi:MAG: Hsp20/alpha crystallin family protein [Deltaproteobacteria bacterium]|nr:Hsp20/alpha crystallin family protein [Deltaproteobacteria bacterium]
MGRGSDEAFRDLLGLQEKMCRLFDEQLTQSRSAKDPVSAHWSPAVDIYETGDDFVLVAEVPGMTQEDIHLEITDDVLVVRGERPSATGEASHRYHRVERPNGLFQRAFRLPAVVDPGGVTASYRDGILCVTLPKREAARSRPVSVQVEG